MYKWQQYLGVEDAEMTDYHQMVRKELIDIFSSPRKRVIEIGSSGGGTGAYCKQKFPGCEYWGFELNKAAAREAAKHLDRVVCGKFEEQPLATLGMKPASVDGVVLGDVLEHMYNPWQVLVSLRPWLTPDAEVIISIPNVRNLWLMNEITEGRFEYDKHGLLDITHIRFFTLRDLRRMMAETGYTIEKLNMRIDENLIDFYNQTRHTRGPCALHYRSISIKTLGENIPEFCTKQFMFMAKMLPDTKSAQP